MLLVLPHSLLSGSEKLVGFFSNPKSSEQYNLKSLYPCHAGSSVHYIFRYLRSHKSLLKGIIFRKYLVTYLMAGHLPFLCISERLPASSPEHKFVLLCSDLCISKASISVCGSIVSDFLTCYTALFFPSLCCSKITYPCFFLFSF